MLRIISTVPFTVNTYARERLSFRVPRSGVLEPSEIEVGARNAERETRNELLALLVIGRVGTMAIRLSREKPGVPGLIDRVPTMKRMGLPPGRIRDEEYGGIDPMGQVMGREELIEERGRRRREGKRVVFTNGCFDLLHPGHVRYLRQARSLGDLLVVALNSDASVRVLKGAGRPILNQDERAEVMAALEVVDYVTIFDEETPGELIARLLPDVLVKGGDWPIESIVGREEVEAAGGRVLSLPYLEGSSTSEIVERIRGKSDVDFGF